MNLKHYTTFLLLTITSTYAISNDIRVVTGLSLGYSEFTFPEKLDHSISFPSASVPIALTYKQWQISANLQSSLRDADIAEEEDVGSASRQDIDFTLGYQLSNQWSLFAGYKYGKTKMQFSPRDAEDEEEVMLSNESYAQKGPFIGVSYAWQFDKAGRLAISIAYADLNATNNFSANTDDDEEPDEIDEEVEFDDLTGQVLGDTSGFSYALSWTMPLSSQLIFQTRLKINDYQQDIAFNDTVFKNIDETFTTLHVGVAYVF